MKLENISPPTNEELIGGSGVSKQAARDWNIYIRNCYMRYELVSHWINKYFEGKINGKKVLDWGCAIGGVAILLQENMPLNMYCADVDKYSISWLNKTNQSLKCSVLPYQPSIPYDDDFFDCIYGISVLTHLPIEQQEDYLSELRRIAMPGALIILTVASDHVCVRNKDIAPNNPLYEKDTEKLHREGIIYHEYDKNTLNNLEFAKDKSYGLTFHSQKYIEEVFSRYFKMIECIKGGLGDYQDVLILSKN